MRRRGDCGYAANREQAMAGFKARWPVSNRYLKQGRRDIQMAAALEVVRRITSRRTYDRGATNSGGDNDGDNIRSSELSNENRSP
jgi:hypothetical protein